MRLSPLLVALFVHAASFTVTTSSDTGTGSGTSGDLRHVLRLVNAPPGATDASGHAEVTAQADGAAGAYEVQVRAGEVSATFTLTNTLTNEGYPSSVTLTGPAEIPFSTTLTLTARVSGGGAGGNVGAPGRRAALPARGGPEGLSVDETGRVLIASGVPEGEHTATVEVTDLAGASAAQSFTVIAEGDGAVSRAPSGCGCTSGGAAGALPFALALLAIATRRRRA